MTPVTAQGRETGHCVGEAALRESYEDFVASVFGAMGIPPAKVQNLPIRTETPTTMSVDSPRVDGPPSGHDASTSGTQSDEQSNATSRETEAARRQESDLVYWKVTKHKLVRAEAHSQPGLRRGTSRGTMYFGSSDDPKELCQSYCQTGTCPRKGRCRFVHDPQKVRVCPGWLARECATVSCPLQHAIRPELMPHCELFQVGRCADTNCPFLHAVYNRQTRDCIHFRRGYCFRGATCWRRHAYDD